jgi:DNA ligase-1
MVSRSGNPFHVPKWFTRNFPSTSLDGELWIGRQQFSELVSIVLEIAIRPMKLIS